MKRKLLRTAAVLLAAVMGILTAGCKDSDGDKVDIGYQPNYQMIIDSADDINCDYLLVYHSTASFSEIDAFVDLLEKLSNASSAKFQICPDTLTVPDDTQKIILLGNTTYPESAKSNSIINSIRSNNYYDYLLRNYGSVLSVNWVSKFGRDEAFSYLLETVLPAGLKSVFGTDYSHLYLSERSDTPIVTINDINIIQYSVVLPSAPSYMERYAAEQLVRAVKNATGEEIPIVTDDAEESTYEILIGNNNRGETYVTSFFAYKRFAVVQYGNKLILRGGQIEATAAAVAMFANAIENATITAEPLHIKPNYVKTGNTERYGGDTLNGYNLVYSDEFNTTTLGGTWKTDKGSIASYGPGGALLYYDPRNVRVDGNNLVLTTFLGGEGYMTGHVTSEDALSFQHGYVEIRAKFRTAPGYWVKFMLSNQNDRKETVSQIDVFNSLNDPDTVFASAGVLSTADYYENYLSLIDPSYETYREYTLEEGKTFNEEEYHTYGVEWTSEYIRLFVDGINYGTIEVTSEKFDELDTEMYFDFLIGVEMTEERTDNEAANWPADFSIDWIRLYQRKGSTFTDRTVNSSHE